ncbi:MAG: Ig-like domain-containing protein [Halioglobus sp.]
MTDRDPPDLPDRVAVNELPSGDTGGSTFGGWFWRDDLPDPRPLILKLEEPVDGEAISGVGNLRGYALGLDGVTKVEIFIDGEYAFDAPYGGSRTDVQGVFPDIPGAENSGFSLAYGYANLSPGEHRITARATTPQGKIAEASATFTVLAFQAPFIFANQPVAIPPGGVSVSGDELYIEKLSVDGETFDVTLRWRTATQSFDIIEVR